MQCCCTLYQVELVFALVKVCLRTAAFLWPGAALTCLPACAALHTDPSPYAPYSDHVCAHAQLSPRPKTQDSSNYSYNQFIKTSTPQVATDLIKYLIISEVQHQELQCVQSERFLCRCLAERRRLQPSQVNRTSLNSRPT